MTYPRRCATDHIRGMKTKINGYTRIVYGTANQPLTAPVAYIAAGTATKVYAV